MRFDVITLFPDLVKDSFNYGVTGRALTSQKISLNTLNPREIRFLNNCLLHARPEEVLADCQQGSSLTWMTEEMMIPFQ